MFSKIVNYCKACYDELAHKATWPSRTQLTRSAMVVISTPVIITLVVSAMDSVSQRVMEFVYPR